MPQTTNQINKYLQSGYGLTSALPYLAPVPVISGSATSAGRAPTTNDKLPIGSVWIWAPQNTAYILTSITNNQANWLDFSGGVLNPNSIALPNTNAAATIGIITQGGTIIEHNGGGVNNTFFGPLAGNPGNITTGHDDTAYGAFALGGVTTGNGNVALGDSALIVMTTGSNNTAVGFNSLSAQTTASQNTAVGRQAGAGLTTGGQNIMIGDQSGDTITTGTGNIIIGVAAGSSYVAAESNNICIDAAGVVGDNNTINIGTPGAGAGQQNRCFIAGIRGITTANNNAIAVLVDSASQLGTVSSSEKVKENIVDMGDTKVLQLRPVSFDYKDRHFRYKQTGLIAEEVNSIMPELVAFGEDGAPESVKYHDLPVLLLAEVQKLRKEVDALKGSK